MCPYLNVGFELGMGRNHPRSPSLDRIIPDLGYVSGNVRIISLLANAMKSNIPPELMRVYAPAFARNYLLLHPDSSTTQAK
jgi:hypothetical protein